jgi:hypothetical protein
MKLFPYLPPTVLDQLAVASKSLKTAIELIPPEMVDVETFLCRVLWDLEHAKESWSEKK